MPELDPNTRLLHALEPVVEQELNRHLSVAQPWMPHDFVPYDEGRNFAALGGEDWTSQQSKLSKIGQIAMFINLLTEDNLPSYHRALVDQFGKDAPWRQWTGRWTAEEGRHAIVIRDFLVVTRGIDPVELENARMSLLEKGHDEGQKSPLETLVYVTLQELATRVSHRNTGKICRDDPLAEPLLQRIAKDENLHMLFYRNLVTAAFEIDPNLTMEAVRNEIVSFAMPGVEIENFLRYSVQIAKAGIYDQQLYLNEVVDPTLKYWNVWNRKDLDGSGAAARDELAVFLQKKRADAANFVDKRAKAREKILRTTNTVLWVAS